MSRLDVRAVADSLRRLGYDIEPAQATAGRDVALVARRDLGERGILFVLDASGRFRFELTSLVRESARRDVVAGVTVRVVETASRAVNMVGEVVDEPQAVALIVALGDFESATSRLEFRPVPIQRKPSPPS